MKKSKNIGEMGITLMSLVITIIVLVILASIGISSGISTVEEAKLDKFNYEMRLMKIAVDDWYESWKNGNTTILDRGSSINGNAQAQKVFTQDESGIEYDQTVEDNYRYYDKNLIKELGIEGIEQDYFVSVKDRMVVSYEGLEYKGERYYIIDQLPGVDLYNVKDAKKEGTPSFSAKSNIDEAGNKTIEIYNIQHSNNDIKKWTVEYKLKDESTWKSSKNLSFKVQKRGIYEVRITNNDEIFSEIVEVEV